MCYHDGNGDGIGVRFQIHLHQDHAESDWNISQHFGTLIIIQLTGFLGGFRARTRLFNSGFKLFISVYSCLKPNLVRVLVGLIEITSHFIAEHFAIGLHDDGEEIGMERHRRLAGHDQFLRVGGVVGVEFQSVLAVRYRYRNLKKKIAIAIE